MKGLGKLTRVYLGLAAFSLAGTLLSRLTGLDPGWIAPISAGLTLLVGVAAVFAPAVRNSRHWIAMALVLSVGAVIEIVGMKTGIPFGRYSYTDQWIPVVDVGGDPFPLLVPFAWLLITAASFLFALKALQDLNPRGDVSLPTAIPLAAGIAALVDLPMEWAMTGELGYWRWDPPGPLPGGASILNPVGWFLTGLLASVILAKSEIGTDNGRPLPNVGDDATFVLLGHLVMVLGIGVIGLLPQL